MVRIVRAKEKQKKKSGRPPKLRIEDQILLTLQYIARIWRVQLKDLKNIKKTFIVENKGSILLKTK